MNRKEKANALAIIIGVSVVGIGLIITGVVIRNSEFFAIGLGLIMIDALVASQSVG